MYLIDFLFYSLSENQSLKLGDSALSKDLFPSDYHCLGDNDNRPIKWMPLESIVFNKYSRASDVVSSFPFPFEVRRVTSF